MMQTAMTATWKCTSSWHAVPHAHVVQHGHHSRPHKQCSRHTTCMAGVHDQTDITDQAVFSERGVSFMTGRAFYRQESAQGRDLAMLAASVYKRKHGQLSVLDVMAASGVRGARYLEQAGADRVWSNDFNSSLHNQMVYNLCNHTLGPPPGHSLDDPWTPPAPPQLASMVDHWHESSKVLVPTGLKKDVWEWQVPTSEQQQDQQQHRPPNHVGHRSIRVSHMDAKRLLTACYLNEDYHDLIDLDSFGSDTSFLGNAIETVKYGGLLYLTSTDGFSSGGRRPHRSLAAYGCYARPLPWANEQGLRMLIGAAVKEGAARGVVLQPVFSLYSYHGPVFRVMLRATRSAEWPVQHYKMVGHCHVHDTARPLDWDDLGEVRCRCVKHGDADAARRATALAVAGPMWTGPLHNTTDIQEMQEEAQLRGWSGHSTDSWLGGGGQMSPTKTKKSMARPLEEVLQVLLEESDERLPPGFIPITSLGSYLTQYPPRDKLIAELRANGFAASRCHLENKAFRTDASIKDIVNCGVALGVPRRLDCPAQL